MKLRVGLCDMGRRQPQLVVMDESGAPLPGQRSVTLYDNHLEVPVITVELVVDGGDVAFVNPGGTFHPGVMPPVVSHK
jgi:hypothetical protein